MWLWAGCSPSIFSWFATIWLAGLKLYRTDDDNYLQLRTFFEDQDDSFYRPTTGIEALQHRMGKVCVDRRRDYVEEKKIHFVKFDHRIIASLWTFQPTLVCAGDTEWPSDTVVYLSLSSYFCSFFGCVYHHTSVVELIRFPNDFQSDFCRW